MAKTLSPAFRVEVLPAPTWTPPYALPGAGQAVQIASNSFSSIAPAPLSASQFSGSVFSSYGAGIFVDSYSAAGAWVLAGSGGHAHTEYYGAAIFDFSDALWKYRAPAAAAATPSGVGRAVSASNGSPFYELTGTEVPLAPHPYMMQAPLPPARGGGLRGSVVWIGRAGVGQEARISPTMHRFDLETGVWSRLSSSSLAHGVTFEGDVLFDPSTGRYYQTSNSQHIYSTLRYVDAADWVERSLGAFSPLPGAAASGRLVMFGQYILRHAESNGALWIFDTLSPNTGWSQLTTTGPLPTEVNDTRSRWAVLNGRLYHMDTAGGSTLTRMVPPASNLRAGTWTVSTISLNLSLPAHPHGTLAHYGCLVAVPIINCLAWINPAGVYLIRPE